MISVGSFPLLTTNMEYTDEQISRLGELMSGQLIEKIKDDPMKLYLLLEVLEGLERGDDVNNDLVELFKNTMVDVLIDGTLEFDEE